MAQFSLICATYSQRVGIPKHVVVDVAAYVIVEIPRLLSFEAFYAVRAWAITAAEFFCFSTCVMTSFFDDYFGSR